MLCVVCIFAMQQQRVKLGEYQRDEESLVKHGSNKQCLVQEKRGQLVVLVRSTPITRFCIKIALAPEIS